MTSSGVGSPALTEARLAELEAMAGAAQARAGKATPGPWRWWTSNSLRRLSSDPSGKDGDVAHAFVARDGVPDIAVREEDMALIASARTDVPALAAEVRELLARTADAPTFTTMPPFVHVRELEAFEGPILSELRFAGRVYLEKWCTNRDGIVRTVIVRSDHRAVAEYLAGRMTMLDLLTRPNEDVGFLRDGAGGELRAARLVQVSSLPPDYLPAPDARHDESLRPVPTGWEEEA